MNALLATLGTSLAVSALAAPFVLRALARLKSQQSIHKDAPETHQVKAGTPTMGGFIVLIGALAGLVVAAALGQTDALAPAALLICFGVIGFLDDFVAPRVLNGKRGLGWIPKLTMQVAAGAGALLAFNPQLPMWALATGLFFILFFTNAYNFSDGLDGLAGLLGIFMALGLFFVQPSSAALALIGGLVVFLCYNAPPARVFMGDVGSLAVGSVFGLLFFQGVHAEAPQSFAQFISAERFWLLAALSVVMIAELAPVPLQIFWVKVFKKRLFPYTPIHHAFEKAGWPETRVTFLFVMVQAACVAAVLAWKTGRPV